MSVKIEPSGRRSVEVEIEVPGTPEEVWQAIATGPGISSWFVPATFEERDGVPVAMTYDFGSGGDSSAKITDWDPPRRFVAEGMDLGPEGPPVATEWIVEARSGGACVVRVVHSLFASSDEWDDQIRSWDSGWPTHFHILRLRLAHFRGQPCAPLHLLASIAEPAPEVWERLTGSLGLPDARQGHHPAPPAGAPPLGGEVDRVVEDGDRHEVFLRLDTPAPGLTLLFASPIGDKVFVQICLYFYGDQAPQAMERAAPQWRSWLATTFPSASGSLPWS